MPNRKTTLGLKRILALAAGLPFLLASCTFGQSMLGFDLSNATIPTDEIKRGGPPPDGIPSIDNPKFSDVEDVNYLQEDDIVLGFEHNGVRRAYPFRIMVWHEIVNDTVGGKPIAATYCPLCGTAMVFSREFDGETLEFGVSGLLYNSDVLMFDRKTDSLWSQIKAEAVSGKYAGTEMEWLPGEQMTWSAWREKYPGSEVLNLETGHNRDYGKEAYQSYFQSGRTMFPYERNNDRLEAKKWVVGVEYKGNAKAYPLDELPANKTVEDTIGDATVTFTYDPDAKNFNIRDADGNEIPAVQAFWFAWQAFHPETEVYERHFY